MEKGKVVDHLLVLVSGNFPDANRLYFTIGGKKYFVAETTLPGFRLGESVPANPVTGDRFDPRSIRYFQKPGESLVDWRTGEKVPFL